MSSWPTVQIPSMLQRQSVHCASGREECSAVAGAIGRIEGHSEESLQRLIVLGWTIGALQSPRY